jgi:hypothetical protein
MASSKRGAEGLRGADGREEMIDRPMVLQVSLCVRGSDAHALIVSPANIGRTDAPRSIGCWEASKERFESISSVQYRSTIAYEEKLSKLW